MPNAEYNSKRPSYKLASVQIGMPDEMPALMINGYAAHDEPSPATPESPASVVLRDGSVMVSGTINFRSKPGTAIRAAVDGRAELQKLIDQLCAARDKAFPRAHEPAPVKKDARVARTPMSAPAPARKGLSKEK